MRLICPNCDAEYQVDDAAIPETGRDVQCSNCGHAWFQLSADAENARDAEEQLFGETPAPAPPPPPMPAPVEAPVAAAKDIAEPDQDPEPAPRPVGPRQSLAESVLSVLREEAERESAVRREEEPMASAAEAPGIVEMQPELGLEEAAQSGSPSAAARHIARLKGADPDAAPIAEPRAAARRDLLPDIEEINSTLRADNDRAQSQMDEIDALPDLKKSRRGFRSGFVLMMIVAVALAMAYVMAPRIIAQIPGSAPTMRAYVASVDQGRLWLDDAMKSAIGAVRSISGASN